MGWADFQVRSDTAIRRHQALVNCAFSFCWATWFADHLSRDAAGPQPRREGSARRAAATCLPMTVVWLVAEGARHPAWQAIALAPVQDWAHGWLHLTGTGVTRTFLLVAPVAIPAWLGLAALAWAWRIYALTAGIGGWTASAPITFDARQWKRQVRTAKGRTAAPGSVPLLTRGERITVGGTIRAVGHRWHQVFTVAPAACARHMVIVGATGSGNPTREISDMGCRQSR